MLFSTEIDSGACLSAWFEAALSSTCEFRTRWLIWSRRTLRSNREAGRMERTIAEVDKEVVSEVDAIRAVRVEDSRVVDKAVAGITLSISAADGIKVDKDVLKAVPVEEGRTWAEGISRGNPSKTAHSQYSFFIFKFCKELKRKNKQKVQTEIIQQQFQSSLSCFDCIDKAADSSRSAMPTTTNSMANITSKQHKVCASLSVFLIRYLCCVYRGSRIVFWGIKIARAYWFRLIQEKSIRLNDHRQVFSS